jgi:hypothetical protein
MTELTGTAFALKNWKLRKPMRPRQEPGVVKSWGFGGGNRAGVPLSFPRNWKTFFALGLRRLGGRGVGGIDDANERDEHAAQRHTPER